MIVKQIKYYDEGEKQFLNNPVDITAEKLVSGDYFNAVTCDEIQIKAYPGTMLKINGEEIVIGQVGVYNILLAENTEITSLMVDKESIDFIKNTPLAYLIITFIQSDGASNGKSDTVDDNGATSPVDKDAFTSDNHDNWKIKK